MAADEVSPCAYAPIFSSGTVYSQYDSNNMSGTMLLNHYMQYDCMEKKQSMLIVSNDHYQTSQCLTVMLVH